MRAYPAQNLLHALARIEEVKANVVHHQSKGGEWPQTERFRCQNLLKQANEGLEKLEGLKCAKDLCAKLASEIITPLSFDHVTATANDIRENLRSDLESQKLFIVTHSEYYENPLLAGEAFRDKWPNAREELMEAGNCFALNRNTGCACHLMRATEYVLRAFEDALGIPPSPRDSWGGILSNIEDCRGYKGRSVPGHGSIPPVPPSAKWMVKANFFESCYTYLGGVKASCRDPVFHVRTSYTEIQAERLFGSVRSFLSHASEDLEEIK